MDVGWVQVLGLILPPLYMLASGPEVWVWEHGYLSGTACTYIDFPTDVYCEHFGPGWKYIRDYQRSFLPYCGIQTGKRAHYPRRGMSMGRGDETMRPDQRVVTQLPLTELWDVHGVLRVERKRVVGRERVADLLRNGRVRFVVANCGDPLKWIPPNDSYRFWTEEVKHHLVEPEVAENGFRLEDWPGQYCFVGTEWGEDPRDNVVLLEAHH